MFRGVSGSHKKKLNSKQQQEIDIWAERKCKEYKIDFIDKWIKQ